MCMGWWFAVFLAGVIALASVGLPAVVGAGGFSGGELAGLPSLHL
jgi:hypothetical protein